MMRGIVMMGWRAVSTGGNGLDGGAQARVDTAVAVEEEEGAGGGCRRRIIDLWDGMGWDGWDGWDGWVMWAGVLFVMCEVTGIIYYFLVWRLVVRS